MQDSNSQAIDVMEDDQITQLLGAVRDGNVTAAEELFAITCAELRKIAKSAMRTQPANHTLQPTALVNEAVVRILIRDLSRQANQTKAFPHGPPDFFDGFSLSHFFQQRQELGAAVVARFADRGEAFFVVGRKQIQ